MKSRVKKQAIRSIVSRTKEILHHPQWWGDSKSNCYAPFVNEAVSLGLYPETWGYSEATKSSSFDSMYISFVYTRLLSSGKIKNDIGYINIFLKNNFNSDLRQDHANLFPTEVTSNNKFDIRFSRSRFSNSSPVKASIFSIKTIDTNNILKEIMPIVSEYLSDFHQSSLLFSGSLFSNPIKDLEHRNIMIAILESYWSYAEGGITHVYKMKEGFNMENGWDKINISQDDLDVFIHEYNSLKESLVCCSGHKLVERILLSFENKAKEDK